MGDRERKCYKCDKPGHIAKDCPEEGGDGGGGVACYKCGEYGHVARDCQSQGRGGGGGRSYGGGGGGRSYDSGRDRSRGEVGHISSDCPSKSRGGGGGGRDLQCYNCQGYGHLARDCDKAHTK